MSSHSKIGYDFGLTTMLIFCYGCGHGFGNGHGQGAACILSMIRLHLVTALVFKVSLLGSILVLKKDGPWDDSDYW